MNMPKCAEDGCGEPMELSGVILSCHNQHVLEIGYTDPLVQAIAERVKTEKVTGFPCVIDSNHVILAESEVKREPDSYPYTIILVMRADAPCKELPFVTWMSADIGGRSLSGGHYDLSLSAACCDYLERCQAHALAPGKMFGDYMFGPKPSGKGKQ